MYKKFFSAILFGVLTIASTSTFVSCKDYDDDINNLQAQIDELNNKKIAEINSTIVELKNADAALQKAITDGDAATLAAAKTLIAEAIADCQKACKENLAKSQAEQDVKYDEAIAKVNQRVDDVIKLLSDQDGNIQQVGKDLKALSDKLANFESQYGNLTTAFTELTKRVTNLEDAVKAQKAALDDLAKTIGTGTGSNGYDDTTLKQDIKTAGDRITTLEGKVNDLQSQLTEKYNELSGKLNTVSGDLDDLKKAHSDFVTETNNKLTDLGTQIGNVKSLAESTASDLGKLDVMFKILVNDLRSLVYMPKLYVDGIETIEYPYLKYERLTNVKNLAQTRKEADDDVTVNLRDLEDFRKSATPDSVAYGPVWPIQYHMNPGNASTEYASIKGYYAYEAEVLTRAFYDTKNNAAGTWGIVPADRWVNQYNTADMIWNKTNGIMTIGLQITKPESIDNPGMPGTNHFPTDLKENSRDGQSPESVKNVILALQANSKKDAAQYAGAGKDTVITSDYAQVLMEKVKIEGMIWNTNPGYWRSQNERIKDFWEQKKGYGTGDYASCAALDGGTPYKYRTGDGTPTNGRDEIGPRCEKWVHVWDTPEEALLHPADIELYIDQEVVLSKYLGVHWYFDQNEPITENVASHKNIQTWKFDAPELQRYGFVWVFDTVDYYVDTNKTHDSRYMRFTDHKTGALVSADITETGATYESTTHTSVGREPLVRVRLYHFSDISDMNKWRNLNTSTTPQKDINDFNSLNAKCVIDGYIRLHITRPEKIEIEYPTENFTFDLCNDASTTKYGRTNYWDYAMFNARVLKTALNNMEKEQFDAAYRVELAAGASAPTGTNRAVEVAQYVQSGSPIAESPNEYYYYKNVTGVAFNYTNWSACQIGQIWTEENVDGVSNHTYWWSIPADQLEALTHHAGSPDAGSAPITITRWIHYTGHFYSSTAPNNNAATYDDIFIKLTLTIKRADVAKSETSGKDENYWYKYDNSVNNWLSIRTNEALWSIANNVEYPRDDEDPADADATQEFHTYPWTYDILKTWDQNKVSVTNATGGSKLYFAPYEYEITALDGTVYVVTPKRGKNDNIYNKFICKYIPGNTHQFKFLSSDPYKVDESANNAILNNCAIKYGPEASEIAAGFNASQYPQLDGVFSNDTLFAYKKNTEANLEEYEPIAIIKNNGVTPATGAEVELLHEYVENQWVVQQPHDATTLGQVGKDYQPSGNKWNNADPATKENEYTEALVNAVGYLTIIERDATTGLMTGKFEDKGNPLKDQLRAMVGVIATNKCNIANQMTDKAIGNFAVFQMSWERPINILQEADAMIDAKNNADFIYVVDIIKLFDWRGVNEGHMWGEYPIPSYWKEQTWKNHQWLWAYYNVKAVTLDLRTNVVKTNLSQTNANTFVTLSSVSNKVLLKGSDGARVGGTDRYQYNFNLRKPDAPFFDLSRHDRNWTPDIIDDDIVEYMGLDNPEIEGLDAEKARFGYIKYENNGQNVYDFDVKVPVSIKYDWGEILDQPITIHIHGTLGNH